MLYGIKLARSLSMTKVILLLGLEVWQATLQYVYRDANKCAHLLAKCGLDAPLQCQVINSTDSVLAVFVFNDCNGSVTPNFVS